MWQHVRNVLLLLGWSAICSASVVGMLAVLLAACGIHVGWLLALLSVPPGVALGVVLARALGRQLLTSGADRRKPRRTARWEERAILKRSKKHEPSPWTVRGGRADLYQLGRGLPLVDAADLLELADPQEEA